MSNGQTLFMVRFKVRPTVKHPLYWEMELGFLMAWCFDTAGEDALHRMTAIIDQLPFELIGDGSATVFSGHDAVDSEVKQMKADEARAIGVSFTVFAARTGEMSESEFA